jgi:hypothetical protein
MKKQAQAVMKNKAAKDGQEEARELIRKVLPR